MEYAVVELLRGSGYLVSGYLFTKNTRWEDKLHLRCRERKCSAKGYVLLENGEYKFLLHTLIDFLIFFTFLY